MAECAVVYSPLARQDLEEIQDYISIELKTPVAAMETISAILDGAESLEDFPLIGSLVDGLPFMVDEYRFLAVRNYLIFYRVTVGRVFIDRILYTRRDYMPLLGLQ